MVFKWPEPESDFWADLAGLRKTVFVHVREKDTGRQWEMHLKPAKDRTHRKLFAYFLPMGALRTAMRAQVDKLLEEKRLPLVLDIDDTLVRAVGAENKYVKAEHVALLPPSRLANLRDGRQIVLASSMLRFLDWAREKFEISICSIGDQDYVNQIAEFLNRGVLPGAPPRITGVTYSARPEYEHLKQVHGQDKELQDKSGKGALPPPKDLRSLYGFWHVHDMEKGKPVAPSDGFGFGLEALIVDDNPLAWPKNQLPHLIEIRPKVNTEAGIWDVSFGPVQAALASIHARFFEDHAVWSENRTLPQASVLNFYNEYCRRLLTKAIAEEN
ncbi:hypothetical protein DFS34DRAFT_585718 [Phlyctochytrium arcticum]|nr:hypothetical protein DFS34DRAFT_585718 [Phlyctochytrium arcticum]